MPKLVRNEETGITYLFIGFHEWAWSLRTAGFRVYAITADGKAIPVGYTSKRPTWYELPPNTVAVYREYVTNSGYRIYYIYTIPELREFTIDERNNYNIPTELPNIIRDFFSQELKIF